MFKKIFVATMLSSIILVATQANICGAMIAPHQMYLGGITYGLKIDELKKITANQRRFTTALKNTVTQRVVMATAY